MSDTAQRADARLARPLRQVHDLRDVLPGGGGDAPLPRARSTSAPRPSATGAPAPSPDASLDLCSSCGICTQVCPQGVHDRRDQLPGAGAAQGGHGHPPARPAHRAADPRRPPRAPRSRRSPTGPCATGSLRTLLEKTLGIHRAAPMPSWAGRTLPAWRAQARHAAGPTAAARAPRTVVYFHGCGANYYEPDTARAGRGGAGAQRPRGDRAAARAAAACRCRATASSPTRASYVRRAGRAARALRPGRPRHRGHLHELRADAQARGARDPGRRGRRPARSSASASTTSASTW